MTARTPARTKASSGVLHFRDLGPLVVDRADEPVPLVGARLVGALTLLLVQAGHVVSADALAAAMWGEDAGPPRRRPPSTRTSGGCATCSSPAAPAASPPPCCCASRAATGSSPRPTQVDSLRFAVLADETLRLLADGQAERALRRCEEALQLWRGGRSPPSPTSRGPARPWPGSRSSARRCGNGTIAALLAIGDPERALVELTSAIADDPLRERLWVQRMLAYHRTGRTDRALATYQEARSLFRAELGIEPGRELRALQAQILAGDAGRRTVPAPRVETRRPATEVHLPARSVRLIGRDRERDRVQALVRGPPARDDRRGRRVRQDPARARRGAGGGGPRSPTACGPST